MKKIVIIVKKKSRRRKQEREKNQKRINLGVPNEMNSLQKNQNIKNM